MMPDALFLHAQFAQQKQYLSFVAYLMAYGYSRERANEMAEEKTDAE